MKTIKICYVDFWGEINPETFLFTKILRKHFEIVIDSAKPDFAFCGTSGKNFLNFSCPRILFTGEAVCPDFNLYDYAIGFDYLTFGDRYLHYPLCLLNNELLNSALKKHCFNDDYYLSKKKFCNSVISAGGGVSNQRDFYFDEICKYQKVDSGGRYRNNLPEGNPISSKFEFQKEYRFSLALENTAFPGYTTEKIMDAWAASTIPIYWGNPLINKEFNPKSFINCSDFNSTEDLIAFIQDINENDEKYLNMQKEPILSEHSSLSNMLDEKYIEDFLLNIFHQEKTFVRRRNSSLTMIGKFYEHRLTTWNKIENSRMIHFLRELKRSIWGLKHIE